jgi:hypothetical protein
MAGYLVLMRPGENCGLFFDGISHTRPQRNPLKVQDFPATLILALRLDNWITQVTMTPSSVVEVPRIKSQKTYWMCLIEQLPPFSHLGLATSLLYKTS